MRPRKLNIPYCCTGHGPFPPQISFHCTGANVSARDTPKDLRQVEGTEEEA